MTANFNYLHEEDFNDKTKLQRSLLARHLSVFYINNMSLKRNLTSLTAYLDCIRYDLPKIGISETWLRDIVCDLYVICGYPANTQRNKHVFITSNTQRNKHVIIMSKRRFDVIITCLLRCVFAG